MLDFNVSYCQGLDLQLESPWRHLESLHWSVQRQLSNLWLQLP